MYKIMNYDKKDFQVMLIGFFCTIMKSGGLNVDIATEFYISFNMHDVH